MNSLPGCNQWSDRWSSLKVAAVWSVMRSGDAGAAMLAHSLRSRPMKDAGKLSALLCDRNGTVLINKCTSIEAQVLKFVRCLVQVFVLCDVVVNAARSQSVQAQACSVFLILTAGWRPRFYAGLPVSGQPVHYCIWWWYCTGCRYLLERRGLPSGPVVSGDRLDEAINNGCVRQTTVL